MRKQTLSIGGCALCVLSAFLSSCVDDKYDLNNVDTTAKVSVDGLVVPVNLDEIKLSSIIDVKDDGDIKIVDGEYVFTKTGDFTSDNVKIDATTIAAPEIKATECSISIPGELSAVLRAGGAQTATVDIPEASTEFSYSTSGIADEIKGIDSLKVNGVLTIKYNIPALRGVISQYKLKDVKMTFPKGVVCSVSNGTFDAATGVLSIPEIVVTNSATSVNVQFTGVKMADSDIVFDAATHTLKCNSAIKLNSKMEVSSAYLVDGATIPATVQLKNTYTSTDISVNEFSGRVAYTPTDVKSDMISLDNLPDVLSQPGTDISIQNPQVYVAIANPLAKYGLVAKLKADVIAVRGDETTDYRTDEEYFELTKGAAESHFCLSPAMPAKWIDGYSDSRHVKFSALSNVLSGNGMPSALAVDMSGTVVEEQQVVGLPLGTDLGAFAMRYCVYAPINLKAGSQVVYVSTEDGWSSETLEKITIEQIDLKATISTDVPVGLKLTACPLNTLGLPIDDVSIEVSEVPANAQQAPLAITIKGTIEHLDGITFVAVATAADGEPLSSKMSIKLNDVRVKVTGHYITEL